MSDLGKTATRVLRRARNVLGQRGAAASDEAQPAAAKARRVVPQGNRPETGTAEAAQAEVQAQPQPKPQARPVRQRAGVDILVMDSMPGRETCQRIAERGRALARQDDWDRLADLVRMSDANRDVSPAGRPVASLLMSGARCDIIRHARDTIGEEGDGWREGIEALEETLEEYPEDYAVALVLGEAHLDLAQIAADAGLDPAADIAAAGALLDRFNALELNSPALANLRRRHSEMSGRDLQETLDDYEDLAELAPEYAGTLTDLGSYLARNPGGPERLAQEAQRYGDLLGDVWGRGALGWIMLSALATDPALLPKVRGGAVTDGLQDILNRREDPFTANLVAAYLTQALSGRAQPRPSRAEPALRAALIEILRSDIRVLVPQAWAIAAGRPTPCQLSLPSGSDDPEAALAPARAMLEEAYAAELSAGGRVSITPDGVETHPA